jgi:hypothetical protein
MKTSRDPRPDEFARSSRRPRRGLGARSCRVLVGLPLVISLGLSVTAPGTPAEWVRVIVRLRVTEPPTPAAIQVARDSVLRQIANTPHRVARQFETLPLLALEASPEAIEVLRNLTEVLSIEPDALSAPQPARPSGPPAPARRTTP